jgi:hypothetical protein
VSLALAAGQWTALAAPGPEPDPDLPPPAQRPAAEAALEHVDAALARRQHQEPAPRQPVRHDLTIQLRDLRVGLPALAPSDRARARTLLARPTDGRADPERDGYAKPRRARNDCTLTPEQTSHVCVHWVPSSSEPDNAPEDSDTDGDRVPDYVETVRAELETVWQRVVTEGGYRAPVPDRGPEHGAGPDDRLDVYLTDIGAVGLYGYCVPEPESGTAHSTGYCVLDNDYAPGQYGPAQSPLDNLRVTAAHELFHMVQFAYDHEQDWWLMEGTAAWVEDEIHDDINDNLQFLRGGPMTRPRLPLDAPGHGRAGFYTSWSWWRYLGERFPATDGSGMPVVIRNVWERAATRHSLRATVAAISAAGGSFPDVLAAYGEAKRSPATAFSEGASYPTVPLMASYQVAARTRTTQKVASLPHLSSQTFAFAPGRGTRGAAWRLRIPVDAPPRKRGSRVLVTVVGTDGSRSVRAVELDARGNGRISAAFSSATVRRVELTITNAGRRYSCWKGTDLVCQGLSRDNGLRTKFRGIAVRR